ncbi:unnamed protein product [Candidula unifasciata]|uniref:Transcobalamin-like C-terminal domain-containing protein n=1 Tax=Candidula unifasciata TaxID=100452 RepID=A0A8S3YMQ8_9EUPU|nr:unnamed protein product [Candidula unifasciata]
MAKWNLAFALLVLATVTAKYSVGCKRTGSAPGSDPNTRDADAKIYACGICGQPITVTLIVTNKFVEPTFELNITVSNKPQRELIYFLEAASVQNPKFRFTAEHYGTLGYMITKINGLAASVSDQTYWQFLEHPSGNSLQLGASTYVPLDNQTIQFNFTTWDNTHA